MAKVACTCCGTSILVETAQKNQGLCAPCVKEKNTPFPSYPAASAFYLASALLGLNALNLLIQMALSEEGVQSLFKVLIDGGLAIALWMQIPVARLITIARAVLGVLVSSAIYLINAGAASDYVIVGVQVIYSSALIVLLVGDTTKWRMRFGQGVFVLMALLSVLGIMSL